MAKAFPVQSICNISTALLNDDISKISNSFTFNFQNSGYMKNNTMRNNFKYCNVHSIRHYVATNRIYSGADVGTVSNVLGHSNLMTTPNTYANAFKSTSNHATDIMSSVVDEYIE